MSRRRDEDGWALVIALILMLIMAGVAMATMAYVDNEQHQSAVGRERETSFNYAEATLNAQIHALALPGKWPGVGGATNSAVAYPTSCTQASTDSRCPTAATLAGLFASPDTSRGAKWTTMVRDNSGPAGAQTFWNDSMIAGSPTYDANRDGKVWVRAQAVVQGHKRTMVALVRAEQQPEDIPHAALIAGRLSISNMGQKPIIDATGTSAAAGAIQLRCTPTAGESAPCEGHSLSGGLIGTLGGLLSLLSVQIDGATPITGFTGGSSLSSDALSRLQQTAIDNGTYYTSCPTSLTGAVVFIDTASDCSYTANAQYNSPTAPGVVILTKGAISFAGTLDFYGLIYHANTTSSTRDLVDLEGNTQIHGGIQVDGAGGVIAGSSKLNLSFDDNAYDAVQSYGSAGLIQNTWREITG